MSTLHLDNKKIWSRLDKAIHNLEWHNVFDFLQLEHMLMGLPDNTPKLLKLPECPRLEKEFRFCEMRMNDLRFKEILKEATRKKRTKFSKQKYMPQVYSFCCSI